MSTNIRNLSFCKSAAEKSQELNAKVAAISNALQVGEHIPNIP
jgi:hypothetical protein